MGEIEDYLEKENLHSSWIRNMFQMITMGIVLITFFREEKRLKKYIPIPICIILLGIAIGLYSIYYTYYKTIDYEDVITKKYYTWKYLSILTCVVFILVAIFIIKYYDP
jgi:uncharacterized membrane protein YidH (DUF202 family)